MQNVKVNNRPKPKFEVLAAVGLMGVAAPVRG